MLIHIDLVGGKASGYVTQNIVANERLVEFDILKWEGGHCWNGMEIEKARRIC